MRPLPLLAAAVFPDGLAVSDDAEAEARFAGRIWRRVWAGASELRETSGRDGRVAAIDRKPRCVCPCCKVQTRILNL